MGNFFFTRLIIAFFFMISGYTYAAAQSPQGSGYLLAGAMLAAFYASLRLDGLVRDVRGDLLTRMEDAVAEAQKKAKIKEINGEANEQQKTDQN